MCNQGDVVGSTWMWNLQPIEETLCHKDIIWCPSGCIMHTAHGRTDLGAQQARYYLLAETLRRSASHSQNLNLTANENLHFVHASAVTYKVMAGWCWQKLQLTRSFLPHCQQDDLRMHLRSPYRGFNLPWVSINPSPGNRGRFSPNTGFASNNAS